MEIKAAISQAEKCILLNQKSQARAILGEILRREPNSEEAWLLGAQVSDKPEQVRYCLKQVLKINPGSVTARQELDRLLGPQVQEAGVLQVAGTLRPGLRAEAGILPKVAPGTEPGPQTLVSGAAQAAPAAPTEPITKPRPPLPAQSSDLPIRLELPKTASGVDRVDAPTGADMPGWMLTLLQEAGLALAAKNQRQPVMTTSNSIMAAVNYNRDFVLKTDQVIKYGKAVVPWLARYRRTANPDSDAWEVADIILREICGLTQEDFIEKFEKIPGNALIGLSVGGVAGMIFGAFGGIGMVIFYGLLVAVVGWMGVWIFASTSDFIPMPFLARLLLPISAIWKAIQHGSVMKEYRQSLELYEQYLEQADGTDVARMFAGQTKPPTFGGSVPAQSFYLAVQPSASPIVYPLTLRGDWAELTISRRDAIIMKYTGNLGRTGEISLHNGVSNSNLPLLCRFLADKATKVNGKYLLTGRLEDANQKALATLRWHEPSLELRRMDGSLLASYEYKEGIYEYDLNDLERQGFTVGVRKMKAGQGVEGHLYRWNEYNGMFSDEEEMVLLHAYVFLATFIAGFWPS